MSPRGSAKIREVTGRKGSARNHPYTEWRGIYVLIPVVLALLASINTLSNDFAIDDKQQILKNPLITSLAGLPQAFKGTVWSFNAEDISIVWDAYYRPLFMVCFTFNYAIFKTAPWGWHLVSVLIHAGVVLFVFLVLKELTDRRWLAALTAALFAVHPVHSDSVAWVSGVTDPMMALFALPAFYLYLRYRKGGRKYRIAASLVLYFLALLSKEPAIVLPALVAYTEVFFFMESGPLKRRIARALFFSGLYILPTAIYLVMRYQAVGGLLGSGSPRLGLGPVLATAPIATVKYLKLMALPTGYSFFHATPPVASLQGLPFLIPLALIVALVVALILLRSRVPTFAFIWFILWLAPSLIGLRFFVTLHAVQERYVYLPSMGFCLALALGIEWLSKRNLFRLSGGSVAAAVSIALILFLGIVHLGQNRVWRNNDSVFQNSLAVYPRDPLIRIALAGHYYGTGRRQEAGDEVRAALALDPNCVDAYIHMSQVAFNDGKVNSAIEHLEHAKTLVSEGPQKRGYLARIHYELALDYKERKDFDQAEENLLLSMRYMPYPKVWYALGDLYFERGRYEEAAAMYELCLPRVASKFAPIHFKLGRTYEKLSQPGRARDEYQKYLDLAPATFKERGEAMRRLSQL